jgi:hypothetical protein
LLEGLAVQAVLDGLSKSPAAQAHNGESGQVQGASIMKARRVQVF